MEEFSEYDIEPQNKKVHCYRCNRSFYDGDIDVLFDNYICPHCIKQLLKTDVESLIDMASKTNVCKDDVYILLQYVKQINKGINNESKESLKEYDVDVPLPEAKIEDFITLKGKIRTCYIDYPIKVNKYDKVKCSKNCPYYENTIFGPVCYLQYLRSLCEEPDEVQDGNRTSYCLKFFQSRGIKNE